MWADMSLDARSLALFRVALAGVLLIEHLWCLGDAITFLGDAGLLPRYTVLQHILAAEPYRWSIYFFNGSAEAVYFLYAVHAGALIALLVGWRARTAAAVAFFMHTSQHNRNEITRHAFDFLSAGLLFWCTQLPIGATCSIDALQSRLRPLASPGARVRLVGAAPPVDARAMRVPCSLATFALWVQVWVVYFGAISAKQDRAWLRDYSALHLSLQIGYITRPSAVWLLGHPGLLRVATWLTRPIEYVLPVLLYAPTPAALGPWPRLIGVFGLVGFHAGIAYTMQLGIIPWINMAATLPFIPAAAWARPSRLNPALQQSLQSQQRTVYVDADQPAQTLARALSHAAIALLRRPAHAVYLVSTRDGEAPIRKDAGADDAEMTAEIATSDDEIAAPVGGADVESATLLHRADTSRCRRAHAAELTSAAGGGDERSVAPRAWRPRLRAAARACCAAACSNPDARRSGIAHGAPRLFEAAAVALRWFLVWLIFALAWWELGTVDVAKFPPWTVRTPLSILNMYQSFKVRSRPDPRATSARSRRDLGTFHNRRALPGVCTGLRASAADVGFLRRHPRATARQLDDRRHACSPPQAGRRL